MIDTRPQYAPIIIPTLCRYEHLKNCVESLRKSKLAQYTSLYISVDYPPNKKYEEGCEAVKRYVENEINGFKEVVYYFQDTNLGPLGNERFLIDQVYKDYDRYIFTEDDNVFSPAAIEYWNKGLDMFEDDSEIIAICAKAFQEYNGEDKEPIFRMQSFSGYGFATWKNKETEYRSKLTKDMCLEIIKDKKLFHKVYYGNRGVLFGLLNIALEKENIHFDDEGSLACTDFAITLYMIYYNKYAIYPRRFLTRNNGYDGTGVNCKAAVCSDKKLDMSTEFNMQITGYPKEEMVLKGDKWYQRIDRIPMAIEAFMIKHFGTKFYYLLQKKWK